MGVVLECVQRTNQICTRYQGFVELANQAQVDPAQALLTQAMPILAVLMAYALGLYLGRSVWS